ncbi:MAG: hypothetical protein OEZ36_01940, partial [Spirochaetota bacterium]|nr:hypothetical protein [Spirochaetota bacterium]
SLEKMKRIYSRLDFNNIVIIYLLANSLQKNGDKQLAIQFINDSNSSSDRGLLLLKAFCLSSLDKQDDFLKTLLNYIKILDKIDNTELGNILQLISPNVISFENKAVLKYSLKKINFTKQLYHNLIDCYLDCFYAFDESQDYIISLLKQLDSIDNQIITEDENLKIFIAQSYFTLGEYKKVIDNLKLRIKKDQESYELLLYIKALFYNKQDNIELLKLLKLWRENFSFNKFFLRIEIDFRKIINDWKEIEIIADFALQNLENSEDFLTIYMLSLSINEKNEKLKEIIEKIQNHDFQEIQNALLTAKICFESGYPKIAFDIVYKKAIDPKNKRAREIYFVSHINFPKEYFKEYQKVEYNTFVKYIEDGNFKYIEISEKDTHENSLAKKIIGKKVNDEIVLSTPMTSKIYKIRIIRIMNKYLSLLDEINEESQSVSSGYSFEWIKLDKNDIEKTFIETLGIKSTEDKKQKIKNLTDYHNYKIPFSYVTASVFEKNYIKSYSYLTGAQSDGFNITPLYLYNTSINFENSKFIIDYSSALLFFNLSKELGIDFQDKFIVPKTLMIDLEDMIKSVKNMPQPELGVEITQERIHSYSYPKDYKKNYLIFLQNFHDWIEKYAKIELPEKKVEIAHILKDTNDSDGYINYLFDNYYLARNDNYILVTDDQFYFQFFHPHSGKIISTELFLANLFPERKNEIYQLLIERNYIGITVYKEILMQFYLKKVSAQDVNRYFKCLSNLSLVINPSVFTIEQAIEFLQELSFKPISKKQFEREAKVVFGFLIRDIKDKDTINFIKEVIGNKFNLLQDYLDITLISFNDALAINILN